MMDVKWCGVFEPGKIRPIGFMDGYLCTALRIPQGQMLSSWKKCRYSTMLESDLLARVRALDAKAPDLLWCSGDYKNATDLLLKDASLSALSAFEKHPLYQAMIASLGSGRIIYPDGPDKFDPYKGGTTVSQLEGQLMGNPLSFPLLCVINLAVYRLTLYRWMVQDRENRVQMYHLLYHNVIINGDDILFKGPQSLIDDFKSTSSDFGFQISIGKNYVSSDFCQINSQVFIRRKGVMVRKGYLNLRLIKGTNVKTGESQAKPTEIGKSLNEMVSLCPWTSRAVPGAMKRFSRERKTWFEPNWYLPVHLGGYGLDVSMMPENHRFSRDQRRVASMFVADPKLVLFRKNMISHKDKLKFSPDFFSTKIVYGDYVPKMYEQFEEESILDGWVARLNLANLFISGKDPSTSDDFFMSKICKNSRLKPMKTENMKDYFQCRMVVEVVAPIVQNMKPIDYIKYDQEAGFFEREAFMDFENDTVTQHYFL